MTFWLAQAVESNLSDYLTQESFILFLLTLSMILPLVGAAFRMTGKMLESQSRQLDAFREEGAKQRDHDELMLTRANESYQQRFDALQATYQRSIEKIDTRFNATDSLIQTGTHTVTSEITTQRLSVLNHFTAHSEKLEGIHKMLSDHHQQLRQLLAVVQDMDSTLKETKEDQKRYQEDQKRYHQAEIQKLEQIETVLALIKENIQEKLAEQKTST